jgi:hypothetical protein
MKCPKNGGSQYFSYLQKFSLVLMTTVEPVYKFTCAHIGGYGENSEANNLNPSDCREI